MKREIVKIDREKCNGCGVCIPNCHEGALQMIDGKATLVSELMCDGLGACVGHCPVGAIEIEIREAEAYDEVKTMEGIVGMGKNVTIAHLKHLKEHNELAYLRQGVMFLRENQQKLNFNLEEVLQAVHSHIDKAPPIKEVTPSLQEVKAAQSHAHHEGGCPGSQSRSFRPVSEPRPQQTENAGTLASELTHWPIQMHLINPAASHFAGCDLVLAADCVAFTFGGFHSRFLQGKKLAIACPKLDSNKEIYVEKLIRLIEESRINTLTVIKMEVPCCGGLLQMARSAMQAASRKVPIKFITIGIQGDILEEEWV